ncbi:hypothetical protein Tco_0025096 [Tanacetum coccineum]
MASQKQQSVNHLKNLIWHDPMKNVAKKNLMKRNLMGISTLSRRHVIEFTLFLNTGLLGNAGGAVRNLPIVMKVVIDRAVHGSSTKQRQSYMGPALVVNQGCHCKSIVGVMRGMVVGIVLNKMSRVLDVLTLPPLIDQMKF